MDTKLINMIIEKLKSTWKFWFSLVYFTALIMVMFAVYNKHTAKPVPAEPPSPPTPAITVDLDPINKKIAVLEQELSAHTTQLQTLKKEHDIVMAANQRLERRAQSHTEAFKRLCEYVMVITIDKKLVPRQCLPEYRWSKEEG